MIPLQHHRPSGPQHEQSQIDPQRLGRILPVGLYLQSTGPYPTSTGSTKLIKRFLKRFLQERKRPSTTRSTGYPSCMVSIFLALGRIQHTQQHVSSTRQTPKIAVLKKMAGHSLHHRLREGAGYGNGEAGKCKASDELWQGRGGQGTWQFDGRGDEIVRLG